MRYCFYQTTNLLNGKKYLGIHGSEDFSKDTYLGSGTLFREAVRKYGKQNFRREDLRYFDNLEEARNFERLSITPEVLRSPDYYNIAEGGGGGSRGSRPYYEGSRKYLVAPEAVCKFLEEHPDAVEGVPEEVAERHRLRMLGRTAIHRGEEHRLVKKEELADYLEDGWQLGLSEKLVQKNSASKVGIRIMHKGDTTRHVRLPDVESFLKDGYEFGPSEWIGRRNGDRHRGRIKVHREDETRFVSREELDTYLANGYVQGNSPRETRLRKAAYVKTVFMHKGDQERRVPVSSERQFELEGWVRGRTRQTVKRLTNSNVRTAEVRKLRSREEAATRKLVYTKSGEFQKWWKDNKSNYSRIHYSVKDFLLEQGMSKSEFLQRMRDRKEI